MLETVAFLSNKNSSIVLYIIGHYDFIIDRKLSYLEYVIVEGLVSIH